MTAKTVGCITVYVNEDLTSVRVEAVASEMDSGCVGLDTNGMCGGKVCLKLPAGCSSGFIWKEAL